MKKYARGNVSLLLLLLLLKKIGSARLRKSDNYTPHQSEDPNPTIPT